MDEYIEVQMIIFLGIVPVVQLFASLLRGKSMRRFFMNWGLLYVSCIVTLGCVVPYLRNEGIFPFNSGNENELVIWLSENFWQMASYFEYTVYFWLIIIIFVIVIKIVWRLLHWLYRRYIKKEEIASNNTQFTTNVDGCQNI